MARATLKSIALELGVAVTTVSRAMRDDPAIRAETRRRVKQKADELGYVPDRAGVRLRTGKTNVISVLFPIERNMSNYQTRLLEAIAERLKGSGYHLNTSYYFDEEDALRETRYLVETRAADGIILNNTSPRDPRVRYMLDNNFPFAVHGRTDWSERHAYYDYDNHRFATLAVEKLTQLGRRKILAILPPESANYRFEMLSGLEAAADDISVVTCPEVHADSPYLEIDKAVEEAVDALPQIDGILASSPVSCMAAVSAVERRGRKLGKDIDVLSREAIPFLKMFRSELIVAYEDVASAGLFLVDALRQQIEHSECCPLQHLATPSMSDFR